MQYNFKKPCFVFVFGLTSSAHFLVLFARLGMAKSKNHSTHHQSMFFLLYNCLNRP